jgi:hypothetical protein
MLSSLTVIPLRRWDLSRATSPPDAPAGASGAGSPPRAGLGEGEHILPADPLPIR